MSLWDKLYDLEGVLKSDFGSEQRKKRNFNHIRTFFDMEEAGKYTLDDQTWDDFDMDEVYSKVDRTYSSPGESILYNMLRNPLHDKEELNRRSTFIENLKGNAELRTTLQMIYFKLGYDKKNTFLEMMTEDLTENKTKYYLYVLFGKFLPVITILLAIILKSPTMLLGTAICIWINLFINNSEKKNVKSNGLIYLSDLISAAKKVSKVKNNSIKHYTARIDEILKEIKSIDIATKQIYVANFGGGIFEVLTVPFLLEEAAYYKVAGLLKTKKGAILELYHLVGELEAYISISSYQKGLKEITKPSFTDEIKLNIQEGLHPLIEDAVPNTISFTKRGIVLTGTNMSGKSTFLRMIGLNMIFAQTFNFTLTKKYEACFFNIVSSISPNDDVTLGKSYYMAEAEALLRIIKALNKDLPVFCPIDEIFRGTNPIERISSSAEILNYINGKKSISIVATHDRELTDILKENYEFFYFSEKVNKEGLNFDYKLKKGVSTTRNAIKLLDHIGYPKEIIKKSFARAETLEKYM